MNTTGKGTELYAVLLDGVEVFRGNYPTTLCYAHKMRYGVAKARTGEDLRVIHLETGEVVYSFNASGEEWAPEAK